MVQAKTSTLDILDHSIFRLQQLFGGPEKLRVVDKSHLLESQDADGMLEIDGNLTSFIVRNELTLSQLKQLHKKSGELLQSGLLLLGYSDEPQREYCRDNQVNFIDAAGNGYLDLPSIRVAVSGLPDFQVSRSASRVFQKSGLQLLYAFTRRPEILQFSYAAISECVGIAKGTVGEAMTDLRKEGFMVREGDRRVLTNGRKLVKKWAYAYLAVLRPTLYRGTFNYMGDYIVRDIVDNTNEDGARYSGTYAADKRGDYLRGFDAVIYTDLRINDLRKQFRLLPVGKKIVGQEVDVYRSIEPASTMQADDDHLVGDLILYADLIDYDDERVLDAAEKLLNHEIQDRFRENGFRW